MTERTMTDRKAKPGPYQEIRRTTASNAPRPKSWADPGTWTSNKFLPAYIAVAAIAIGLIFFRFLHEPGLDTSTYADCVATFNYTFRVNAALAQAHDHSSHSWEIGYSHEATMSIYNPERSIFGPKPFPDGKIPKLGLRLDEASIYVQQKVKVRGKSLYDEENGAVSDPASLGIAALMFAQRFRGKEYMIAAERQEDLLLKEAPRYSNGAISHRWDKVELWSDAVAMFPPFLAYYGVATDDVGIIQEAARQIGLYRDVLQLKDGKLAGLWKHIESSSDNADEGAWSTGNAWAAYGMAKVRQTIAVWPKSNTTMSAEVANLDLWIREILDAAINTDTDKTGLLRNYLGDDTWFSDTSGTSLLAATAYRMAVISPHVFPARPYLTWADKKRRAVFATLDDDGFAKPAVNPYDHKSRHPAEISPEGESFLLLLGAAWRDCVCNGLCLEKYLAETQSQISQKTSMPSFESLTGISFTAQWQRVLKYFSAP